jgi:hypothetical protein
MKEFCPWFDFDNPAASFEPKTPADNLSSPPTVDHLYASTAVIKNRRKRSEQNLVSKLKNFFVTDASIRL